MTEEATEINVTSVSSLAKPFPEYLYGTLIACISKTFLSDTYCSTALANKTQYNIVSFSI